MPHTRRRRRSYAGSQRATGRRPDSRRAPNITPSACVSARMMNGQERRHVEEEHRALQILEPHQPAGRERDPHRGRAPVARRHVVPGEPQHRRDERPPQHRRADEQDFARTRQTPARFAVRRRSRSRPDGRGSTSSTGSTGRRGRCRGPRGSGRPAASTTRARGPDRAPRPTSTARAVRTGAASSTASGCRPSAVPSRSRRRTSRGRSSGTRRSARAPVSRSRMERCA